jgi:hypothetical protein
MGAMFRWISESKKYPAFDVAKSTDKKKDKENKKDG